MHRLNQLTARVNEGPIEEAFPAELMRRFELYFIPHQEMAISPIQLRQVRAKHVGKLVTVKGIVTRVTEVKCQRVLINF